jgi:hypothetical protein
MRFWARGGCVFLWSLLPARPGRTLGCYYSLWGYRRWLQVMSFHLFGGALGSTRTRGLGRLRSGFGSTQAHGLVSLKISVAFA